MNATEMTLNEMIDAAKQVQMTIGLRYCPTVVRGEQAAFSIASSTKAGVVMLGEGAYWVVCLADAGRLEDAGYEWAPRPA